MSLWRRSIGAGTLLEVSFTRSRADPPQGLVLEVDRGRLVCDEQGEEDAALRLWADRQQTVVLRAVGRFTPVWLTVTHVFLDHHPLDGDVVRKGDCMDVVETPDGATIECGDDLVARIAVRARAPHRAPL